MAQARKPKNDPGPMRIEMVPLSELAEWPGNPKEHDTGGIGESMGRHGYVEPIVRDEGTGRIVAGHGRRETLLEAKAKGEDPPKRVEVRADGEWLVPVLRGIDFGKPEEAEAYLLGANRLVERGGYNLTKLREILERHKANTTGTGWKPGDLEETVRRAKDAVARLQKQTRKKTEQDEEPSEPLANPTTSTGDLWKLGDHRLLCDDATERDSYKRLLGDERPALLLTDPPYGVAYQDTSGARIQGDLTQAAFPVSIACCEEVIDDNARVYVFGASDQLAMADRVFQHEFLMRPRLLIWAKDRFILRHNNYHSQFELVFFAWKGKGGGSSLWWGGRDQSDLWKVGHDSDRIHPNQKPVEVFAIPIRNSSQPGDAVLEPFCGSGTCIIACEQLGRRCFAMEADPGWCDAIVARWEKLTGRKAEKVSRKA